MTALIIVVFLMLLWRDSQFRRARDELAREQASRRKAVESALTEGFRLGASLCAPGSSGDPEAGDRVPAGTAGGAR